MSLRIWQSDHAGCHRSSSAPKLPLDVFL
jgi:hypothetical protein